MAISVQCPQCYVRHHVDDLMAGTQAKCNCGAVVSIPASQPATCSTIRVQCGSCRREHQATHSMAGKAARCGCGAVLQVPMAGGMASGVPSLFAELSPAELNPHARVQNDAPKPRRSEAEILAQYTKNDRGKNSNSHSGESSGYFGFEGRVLNGGVIGGLIAMGAAVAWFLGGLAAGYIFFYPPILFVLGLIAMLKGIIMGKD